jgi:hypothetical protein
MRPTAAPQEAEADVQQLGGQLQDIMSELDDQTLQGQQKATVSEQTPAAEETPANPPAVETASAAAAAVETASAALAQPETTEVSNHEETPVENTVAEESAPSEASQKEDAAADAEKLAAAKTAAVATAEENSPPEASQVEKMESQVISKDDVDTASDDGKTQESENAVDGAMAYIRTRLASEEHKGLRLRQLLAQSVRENRKLRQKVEQMHKQAVEDTKSRKTISAEASEQLKQIEGKLSTQTHRAEVAEMRGQNASRAATIGEKTMKMLASHLKHSKTQVATLLVNLANASHEKDELSRELTESREHDESEAKELLAAKKELEMEKKSLEETARKLAKLQTVKNIEDKSLVALDRQKDLLDQRGKAATKRDQILHKENGVLKTQLAAEVKREEQLREMWSKESEAFTWQLRAERANATEALSDLEKARGEFHDLRKRVQTLRDRASRVELAKHAAEDSANKAQFALSQAETEIKQLRGSVPWLQGEVNRQRQISANATAQMKKAVSERDTLRAILAEAQKNIVQLQGQYADSLRALVVAQSGADEAVAQQKARTAIAAAPGASAAGTSDNMIDTFANLNLGSSGLPGADTSEDASLVEVASRQGRTPSAGNSK